MLKRIAEALDKYSEGYYALKSVVDDYPDLFSSSVISSSTFAEYYCSLYLRYCYPLAHIKYGHGSQKGWDISVTHENGNVKKYQVKSITDFANNRTISKPTRGFDQLFVIVLDAGFNTKAAYSFEGEAILKQLVGYGKLTVPDKMYSSRRGSDIFRCAEDVTNDFLDALSEML